MVSRDSYRDHEGRVLQTAEELCVVLQRLELGIATKGDRDLALRSLSSAKGGMGFHFTSVIDFAGGGELELWANNSGAVGRSPAPGEPDLSFGLNPDDAALARVLRWALTELIRAASRGHAGVDVSAGVLRPFGSDAMGVAMMRIADRLVSRDPRLLTQRQRCAVCGREMSARRSTKTYCGEACKKAKARASKRAARGGQT